jgi:hypothetical protein
MKYEQIKKAYAKFLYQAGHDVRLTPIDYPATGNYGEYVIRKSSGMSFEQSVKSVRGRASWLSIRFWMPEES